MNKTLKKTIIYRMLSILSEYLIVYAATGNFMVSGAVSLACLMVHTFLYYLVEKKI